MKRLICVFLSLFLLCGCNASKSSITVADLLSKPFGCKMDINVLGSEFSGEFVMNSEDSMSLMLSEPQLLNGLTFGYESGDVTASVFGVTVSVDSEKSPSASVSQILFDLYSKEGQNEIAFSEDKIFLVNTSDRGVTTVEFDRNTLVPEKIYNSRGGVEIVLSEYELI